MENFGTVELCVEKRTGNTSSANQEYTPNINIGNRPENNFSSPQQQSFEFDITEQGDYVIAIYSAASEWSDCIIGQLSLTANSYVATGIKDINYPQPQTDVLYDLSGYGIKNDYQLSKGIYIKNGKKYLIK